MRGETESALTLLYSYMGFWMAMGDGDAVDAANENADFWRVYTAALQYTLFVYLGRLADDTSNGKSFSDFNRHCIENVNDYTATVFRLRRPEALELNPGYLDGAQFPRLADLKTLFRMAKGPRRFLQAECKTIRNRVIAHAVFTQENEHQSLFRAISLEEIEDALLVLDSIVKNLYQTYQNARPLSCTVNPFNEKDQIIQNVYRAIMG